MASQDWQTPACTMPDYGSVLQCVYPRVWTGARAKTQTLSSASAPLTMRQWGGRIGKYCPPKKTVRIQQKRKQCVHDNCAELFFVAVFRNEPSIAFHFPSY
jgi:hypothetical protein